jgi:hypothetical protein
LRYKPFGLELSGGGPVPSAAAMISLADFFAVLRGPLGKNRTSTIVMAGNTHCHSSTRKNQLSLLRTMPVLTRPGSIDSKHGNVMEFRICIEAALKLVAKCKKSVNL